MNTGDSRGFTIVETILALALMGLFLLIAFLGLGSRTGNVQFTDSMRSIQSYMQSIQNDTINGVNTKGNFSCAVTSGSIVTAGNAEAGRSDCILMGRIVQFQANSNIFRSYYIVGKFLSQTDDSEAFTGTDLEIFDKSEPMIMLDKLNESLFTEWGLEFVEGKNKGNYTDTIGFIRSPNSSNIYVFTIEGSPSFSGTDHPLPKFTSTNELKIGDEINAQYCFESQSGQEGKLVIGGSSDSIEVIFDEGCI